MKIKFRKLLPNAVVPVYKNMGDAGADLRIARFSGRCEEHTTCRLYPGQIHLVDSGISVEIPLGYEGQIRPRSGLGTKGITIVNSPGTVDSGYSGSLRIALINIGGGYFDLTVGDRVAQLVIAPVVRAEFEEVEELPETERGSNGFGSTGLS
jgi:dUTP pyrophosphatase